MKISLEWLADYLPGSLDPDAAAEALTHGGLPVEHIERRGNDRILDVEVTSNRADCLSYLGVANELSALLDRPMSVVATAHANAATKVSSPTTSERIAVSIEAGDLCPHYTARILEGVRVGPSPAWLADRLSAMGSEGKPARSINNIVDITNYVMYETGQPLHAFDLDKLEGGQIIVRRARVGEKLVTIDGKERTLSPGMLVIADAVKPVALAGVMGGRDTEVSERTTRVLLESARFDPLSVRKTARALAMGSDSSYRFERGIDPTLPPRASQRAADLMLQVAGGSVLAGLVEAGATGCVPKTLTLRLARLQQVLGVEWPAEQVVDALRRLRLQPVLRGQTIDVSVPSDRLDINIEVDLVEEVARVVGYDKVPVRDEISIRVASPDPSALPLASTVSTLCAAGYYEAVTFSFVTDALSTDFLPASGVHPKAPLARASHAVRKADGALRPSLLPGLLEAIFRNESAGTADPRLFEIGSTFWNDADGRVEERRRLGLVGGSDVRETRGVVESLLRKLDADREVHVIPDTRSGFARGACGRLEWGGQPIGYVGKIDRVVADKLSLRDIPAAAEIELMPLLDGARRVPQLRPLPRFPDVRRDLSLVVSESTRYEQIESLIKGLALPNLAATEFVTTYRGKPLEKGQKSITVTLVFRSATETLTGEVVESAVLKVVEAAQAKLAATLRT